MRDLRLPSRLKWSHPSFVMQFLDCLTIEDETDR